MRSIDSLAGRTNFSVLCPAGTVGAVASGGGVGEPSVGCDACVGDLQALVFDGLVAGADSEVRGGAHAVQGRGLQ